MYWLFDVIMGELDRKSSRESYASNISIGDIEKWRQLHKLVEIITKETNVIIASVDTDFYYTFFNEAYKDEIKRITGKEIKIGSNMLEIFADMPEQRDVVIREWSEPLKGKSTNKTIEFGDSKRYTRLYNVLHTPIRDDCGNIIGAGEVAYDVTESKKIEGALKISLAKYKVLFDSFPLGISIADTEGNIIESNAIAESLLGITKEEHERRTIDGTEWRIIRPDGSTMPPSEFASVRALKENRLVENIEMGIIKDEGTTWINVSAAPIPLEGFGVAVTYNDISESKRAESELRNLAATLQEQAVMLDLAHVFVWNAEGKIIVWNRGAERLYGWRKEEALGKEKSELLKTTYPKPLKEIMLELYQKKHWEGELIHKKKNGKKIYVATHWVLLSDSEGNPDAVIETNNEITKLKEIEEQLRSTTEYLENLFNYANAPIIVWDKDFKITRFNRAFEYLANYSAEEVLGKGLTILFPTGTRDDSMEKINKTLSGERWEVVEIPILRKDGEIRTVLWNSANIYAEDGKTIMVTIAQGQDITERKKAEDQLKRTLTEKEMLLKEIHHRVKNNLQVISSLLNLQSRNIKDSRDLDVIERSKNQIKSIALVHDRLARTEDLRYINFREYVNELVRNLFQSYEKSFRIYSKIEIDDTRLDIQKAINCGLIINELVSNSLKYAFPGDEKGEIRISFKGDEDMYNLVVSDTGVGLPKDFELEAAGTLGLRLVLMLIGQLGGKMELDRVQGTKFSMTFPSK